MTKGLSYEEVEKVIENIRSAGVIPSVDTIQRSFDKSQRNFIEEHLKTWKSSSGWGSKYNENMPPKQLIELIKNREKEVEHTLSLVRSTLEATNDGILVVNDEGRIVDYNENFIKLWKLPDGALEKFGEDGSINLVKEQLVNPDEFFGEVHDINSDVEGTGSITDLKFKDGRVYERYSQPHRVHGEIVGRVWSLRDVTTIRKAQDKLKLHQRAIEATPNAVILTDITQEEPSIIYVNSAFEEITGYSKKDAIGKPVSFLYEFDHYRPEIAKLEHAIKGSQEEKVEIRNHRKNGEAYWCEMHVAPVFELITDIDKKNKLFAKKGKERKVVGRKIAHYVTIMSDISARKKIEDQLIHQATHDALTGLPNRLLLLDRLQQAILYAKRERGKAAVLFLDLDHFKLVNDSLGHGIGDDLLKEIARRLMSRVRSTDTIARIGGDEFIIIISPLLNNSEATLTRIIDKILFTIREPIHLDDKKMNITGSLGVSIYPNDSSNGEELIRKADIAMYQVKDTGRNSFCFFTASMNAFVNRRLELQNNLHQALAKNEMRMLYQPIIDVNENRICGFEALIRWHSEELGEVSPLEFIPIAEDIGLIIEIGAWAFETACQQFLKWKNLGTRSLTISINVSARQLYHDSVIVYFKELLKKSNIDPRCIILEITEGTLMENTTKVIETLNELKAMGFSLAIDDFGTGYSSLSYLKNIPVDILKVDRAFVKDLENNENDANITSAIIAVSKALNLKVVAEGVEKKPQLDFLTNIQCDRVQGYYFSKPISGVASTYMLKEFNDDNTELPFEFDRQ